LTEPSGPGVRLDSGIYEGWTVPLEYDPLLAKLAVWGETRESAIARLDRALAEYAVTGGRTNVGFFREIMADAEWRAGRLSTAFLDGFFARRKNAELDLEAEAAAAIVLALGSVTKTESVRSAASVWLGSGREAGLH